MSFLNPIILLAGLGLALPILAHLLNRYQVKRTDWAAMQFLNKNVRVRSRQLRLQDILLLILRCLALLLIVFALSRPVLNQVKGWTARVGEPQAAVIIALDASFSMQHKEGRVTRFDKAIEKIKSLQQSFRPGDPVTLVLLGAEHRVVARNIAYEPKAFEDLLIAQKPTVESLDLDNLPRFLKELASEMKAPQKEIYLLTDLQEKDWKSRSVWLQEAFKDLSKATSFFVIPVETGPENLALTGLELVSGVLRKGSIARYRATVRNCGSMVAQQVKVSGLVNNISVDVKVIPMIAPGTAESVSLFLPFRDAGPVRISAEIADDALPVDNVRRAVAVIQDKVSILCVDGSTGGADGSGALIAAALRAHGNSKGQEDLSVQQVPWVELPSQDLKRFNVVILSDVPDITTEQARAFEAYVRSGRGLIWFGGENVKADVWNERSKLEGTRLLPAAIERTIRTSDAMGVGRPLDPALTDHPVSRALLSLQKDLLSETTFRTLLRVKPVATSVKVLTLAGRESPVLLEHALGRGHVFMFTTTAGPSWNNMAVTPVFPMLLQQMVTYLTAREFETPRQVGDALSLSYTDQPDTTEALFDTPSGETISVPVRDYREQYVALLGNTREAGFYLARVNLQAESKPIAVNVDTQESLVKCLSVSEAAKALEGSGLRLMRSEAELLASVEETRTSRALSHLLLFVGLGFLVLESLFAMGLQWGRKQ
jgi:hypothetical protein